MTVPNLLTFLRIFLTPVLIWFLLEGKLNQALLIFLVAGLTDGLDGFIARAFHQKSKLGAYLDPLADKLLLMSSFVLLGYQQMVPRWLVSLVVIRDCVILLGLMMFMIHHVPVEIRPAVVGKASTLAQLLTVLTALSSQLFSLPSWILMSLFAATGTLSVASGFHYVRVGICIYEQNRVRGDCGG